MLVMYLCAKGIEVAHVFVCYGISMMVMYLCVLGIDVGRV